MTSSCPIPVRRYHARSHKLPAEFSGLMKRKNWSTLSEQTLQIGAAAFVFLRHYTDSRLSEQGIRIAYGMFSKFAMQHCLMRQGFDGPPALCLGNATWACLFWPVEKVSIPGGSDGYVLDSGGSAYWGHVVNPEEWQFLTIV